MRAHGDASLTRAGGKALPVFTGKHRLRHIHMGQFRCRLRRRIPQNQDWQADLRVAQLDRLFQIGHGKPVRAELLIFARQKFRSVPIGVRLDNTAYLCAWV